VEIRLITLVPPPNFDITVWGLTQVVEDKSVKASEDVTRETSAPSRVVAVKGRGPSVLRIHTKERTITSRVTILRGHKPTDFSSIALAAKQFFSSRLKTTPSTVQVMTPSSGRGKDPIILLSPSASSLVTMHNVKALLEEGKFVEPGEAAREAGGGRGPELLHISHKSAKLGGRAVRYVVVEGVEKFRPDYWDRVVCVFTTGTLTTLLCFGGLIVQDKCGSFGSICILIHGNCFSMFTGCLSRTARIR
jgi:RNA pol II accessory factor, Cdc73 family, C-terminal